MKQFRQYIRDFIYSISLSAKLTFLLLVFTLVPALLLSAVTFSTMRRDYIAQQDAIAQSLVIASRQHIDEVVESCNLAGQAVLSNHRLFDRLDDVRTSSDPLSAVELDRLQREVIGGLVNSNPNLHAIRLYTNDIRIPEMDASIYQWERMQRQPWYNNPLPTGNVWKFNIVDNTFPIRSRQEQTYAVLINEAVDYRGRSFGIMEIATPMDELFRNMYHLDGNIWMGFVDSTGTLFYNKSRPSDDWGNIIGSVAYTGTEGGREYTSSLLGVGNHTVLVSRIHVPQFSGQLILAVMLNDGLRHINQLRFIFYAATTLFTIFSAVLLNHLVNWLLRRFYTLMDIAKEVQRGNLNVKVPDMGHDEIGVFAGNFRETVERIRDLLRTSINREMLVKNTEIRALQNQINSHFIYNVLESIKMMAEIEERYAISDAVTSLGKLLRYSMKWATSMVTLGEELDYISNYISLLNLRYDFTITLNIKANSYLLEEKIPKMSLQPIVENAVYHGIEELETDCVIRIHAREFHDYFTVEITDTGIGMPPEKLLLLRKRVYGMVKDDPHRRGGIGLRNVQERIQLCFGEKFGLRIHAKEHCFTKVIVKLPLSGKEAADETVVDC